MKHGHGDCDRGRESLSCRRLAARVPCQTPGELVASPLKAFSPQASVCSSLSPGL